jgi:hypothetical protein
MRQPPLNGPARTLRCPKHRDVWVTLYGQPSAVAWCKCGTPMVKGRAPRGSTTK